MELQNLREKNASLYIELQNQFNIDFLLICFKKSVLIMYYNFTMMH